MITKNTIFALAALIIAAPVCAMESQPSLWSSLWKQSKEYVNYAVTSAPELSSTQRYVAAATVGLAAVGAGYFWFVKKAKPQNKPTPVVPENTSEELNEPAFQVIRRSPSLQIDTSEEMDEPSVNVVMPLEQSTFLANAQQPRIKKSVSFAQEQEVRAIPTRRVQEVWQLQQMVHDAIFMKDLKMLQEAVAADCIMVNRFVSRAAINRSIPVCDLQTLKVWNHCKNYFEQFSVKNLKTISSDLNAIAQLPAPKTLAKLQQLQQHLSALARDMVLLIQRLRNALIRNALKE